MFEQTSTEKIKAEYKKEEGVIVKVKKLRPNSILPKSATPMSSGYDLYYIPSENMGRDILYMHNVITIKPFQTVLIPTGIAIEPSSEIWCAIHGRSSLNKKGILVHTGIIDNDYRGEIMVVATNLSENTMFIEPYQKIAQLVFYDLVQVSFKEAKELSDTSRGTGGFGSTGF